MSKKRNYYEKHVTSYDIETGEVTTQESTVKKAVTKDSFIQTYLEDMSGLMRIKTKTELRVLIHIWKRCQFDTNQIVLVKGIKEQIANDAECSLQTVSNCITTLTKKDLLVRDSSSKKSAIYYLNPKYFFKGYLENRPKALKMIIKYQFQEPEKEKGAKASNELPGQTKMPL